MKCYADNIHLEKYEKVIYFSFASPSFRTNVNALVLPTVHAWDILQVLHSHITVMPKYSSAKFEFPVDKFFKFTLRS